MDELISTEHHKSVQGFMNTEDIVYGYCTEFMVRLDQKTLTNQPFSEEEFRQDMSQFGDSLLVISDDEVVKIHIHTEHPGDVFNYGQRYGSLIKMKIENMREQHTNIVGETHTVLQQEITVKAKRKDKNMELLLFQWEAVLPIFLRVLVLVRLLKVVKR